jgi:hypothetical protein
MKTAAPTKIDRAKLYSLRGDIPKSSVMQKVDFHAVHDPTNAPSKVQTKNRIPGPLFLKLCGCSRLIAAWRRAADELDLGGIEAWEDDMPAIAKRFERLADRAKVDRSGYFLRPMVARAVRRAKENDQTEHDWHVVVVSRPEDSRESRQLDREALRAGGFDAISFVDSEECWEAAMDYYPRAKHVAIAYFDAPVIAGMATDLAGRIAMVSHPDEDRPVFFSMPRDMAVQYSQFRSEELARPLYCGIRCWAARNDLTVEFATVEPAA